VNINAAAADDDGGGGGRGELDGTTNNLVLIILLLFSQTFISYVRSPKRISFGTDSDPGTSTLRGLFIRCLC
jgi:hypothetical protein